MNSPFRYLAAAATPLSVVDVVTAAAMSFRSEQLPLQEALQRQLRAKHVYTFESLMRTTYACMREVAYRTKKRKVIIPRYLCPSFTHGILAAGMEILYCDLDPQTVTIDMKSLKKLPLTDVGAVLCPNFFGIVNPMHELKAYCTSHGLLFIEGADYTLGAHYDNQKLGTYGDIVILNFQEGKAIPVGGGAIVTNTAMKTVKPDEKRTASTTNIPLMLAYSVFTRPFFYSILTQTLNLLKVDKKKLSMEDTIRHTSSEIDFEWSETHLKRLSGFQSQLGSIVLNHLADDMKRRWQNVQLLEAQLNSSARVTLIPRDPKLAQPHYLRYPVIIKKPSQRDLFINKCLKVGIEASPMYSEHGVSIDPKAFPGSYQVAASILTLPCHPYVRSQDITVMSHIFN